MENYVFNLSPCPGKAEDSDCVHSTRFKQMLPLLAKVPVLPCLLTRQLFQDRQQGMFSLLDWISAQVSQSFYHNSLTLTIDLKHSQGRGDSHLKRSGMLAILCRVVNHEFWSWSLWVFMTKCHYFLPSRYF